MYEITQTLSSKLPGRTPSHRIQHKYKQPQLHPKQGPSQAIASALGAHRCQQSDIRSVAGVTGRGQYKGVTLLFRVSSAESSASGHPGLIPPKAQGAFAMASGKVYRAQVKAARTLHCRPSSRVLVPRGHRWHWRCPLASVPCLPSLQHLSLLLPASSQQRNH